MSEDHSARKRENNPEREIPEAKKKQLREILALIKENDTFLIVSTMNLPSGQFQEIRKKIRDFAEIRVMKKTLATKAIDSLEGEVKKLKEHVTDNTAMIFSKFDPFHLCAILSENKSPAKAKTGQRANEDIIVESGPTDLVPGPAISELQSLGLKISIEEGKIHIKEGKVIVKAGEPIKEAAAGLMSKLNIIPFKIGFEPIAAYSNKDKKVYVGIKIDKTKTLEDLKTAYARALAFAVARAYASKDTIIYLLGRAAAHAKSLGKYLKAEDAGQPVPAVS